MGLHFQPRAAPPRSILNWHDLEKSKWHLRGGRSLVRLQKELNAMARIEGVDAEEVEPYIKQALKAQSRKWGAPLLNHLLYARRPSIFRGVRAMWTGIDASGLIDARLQALINRRIASLNGCLF